MAPMEFKVRKDKQGRLTIIPFKEVKSNGDVVMHVPPMAMVQEFMKKNG